MKKLALFLMVGGLASCTSQQISPWDGLTTETEPATKAIDCGSFPFPSDFNDSQVVYDQSGVNNLEAYRLCSEANENIANENAAMVDQLKLARKGLTEAGRSQRNIADLRQEMLEDERKHNFFEKIGLYVVIIGMGIAL